MTTWKRSGKSAKLHDPLYRGGGDASFEDASFEVHTSLAVVVAAVHFRVVLIEVSLGSECVFTLRPKRGVRVRFSRYVSMVSWLYGRERHVRHVLGVV